MKLTDLVLLSLQTAYMQRDITTQGFCAGLDEQIREAAASTYNILMYQALDTLGDTEFAHTLVDELAWQFHCDYYDKTASISVKKAIVKQSIKVHQKKGTPQAVTDLLQAAFPSDTVLQEWFNYGGKPYHFKVITSSLNTVDVDSFLRALNSVKNARSYLDGIFLFEAILCEAINRIKNHTEIEYTMPIGAFEDYTFQDGDGLAFGLAEKEYCFVNL